MKFFKIWLLAIASFALLNNSFSQAPTATGNVMNFSSVGSYESYADDESTWPSLNSIAIQSSTLTTLAELSWFVEDTVYPDFLREVLNTDFIFQIGNYLIKLDLINPRGLIISSENFDAYSALQNNDTNATGMMVLDGNEDFGIELMEALEENIASPSNYQEFLNEARRSCPGASAEQQKKIELWLQTNEQCEDQGQSTIGIDYGMDNKTVYQKAIFYFSLQAKIKSKSWCRFGGNPFTVPVNPFADLKLAGTAKYRKRCGNEVNKSETRIELYSNSGDGILHWRPYHGARSLSHFDFNVDFGIRLPDSNPNNPIFVQSEHYRIKYGY